MLPQDIPVLFVDDDGFYARGYCAELEDHFDVTIARSVNKAETQFLSASKYHCVVLDVMMPIPNDWPDTDKQDAQDGILTGVILLRRCKTLIIEANLPVVVLTNRKLEEVKAEVERLKFPENLIDVRFKADTPAKEMVKIVRRMMRSR